MSRLFKRFLVFLFLPPALLILFVVSCNLWITTTTAGRVYESVDKVDYRPVGLVLGTSKKVAPDTLNQHFVNRVDAAARLLAAGKVDHLLLSGYRDSRYYDETRDMAARLRELGIGENRFSTDPDGSRTIHSVSRASSEFGHDRFTIVSDDFHVARALFIADRLGLDAIAFRSKTVSPVDSRKVRLREYFARVKAVLDVMFLLPSERPEGVALTEEGGE